MADRGRDIPVILVANQSDASSRDMADHDAYMKIRSRYDFAGIEKVKIDSRKREIVYIGKLIERAVELKAEVPAPALQPQEPKAKPTTFSERIQEVIIKKTEPSPEVPNPEPKSKSKLPAHYIVDGPLYRLREAAAAAMVTDATTYEEQFRILEKFKEVKREAFGGLGKIEASVPQEGIGTYSYNWLFSFPSAEKETRLVRWETQTVYGSSDRSTDKPVGTTTKPIYEATGRYFLTQEDWLLFINLGIYRPHISEGVNNRLFSDPQIFVKYALDPSAASFDAGFKTRKEGEDWDQSVYSPLYRSGKHRNFSLETRHSKRVGVGTSDGGYEEVITITKNPPIIDQVNTAIESFLIEAASSLDPVKVAGKHAEVLRVAHSEDKLIRKP